MAWIKRSETWTFLGHQGQKRKSRSRKSLKNNGWADSSAGRAPALQAGSRRFEPCSAHHIFQWSSGTTRATPSLVWLFRGVLRSGEKARRCRSVHGHPETKDFQEGIKESARRQGRCAPGAVNKDDGHLHDSRSFDTCRFLDTI